jgi:ribulose-phosphate 3-epimerase
MPDVFSFLFCILFISFFLFFCCFNMLDMGMYPVQIYPSILSGDFGKLAEEAKRLEKAGADGIHIDIMDGHFVPNLTLGPQAVGAIRKAVPKMFLDVHAMIYNPFDYIEAFVAAGADRVTFHFEATEDVEDTLEFIRKCGKKAGLAFRPETSFSMIPKYLPLCDLILIMTVSPGFGGQAFMPEMIEKIKLTREFCDRNGIRQGGLMNKGLTLPPFDIQVDGGITQETGRLCLDAGANVLVSGNYLFKQPDLKKAIEEMRSHP